jgi:hypothetical protein
MSAVTEIEEAAAKLPPADFARLVEDLRDLQMARATLAEMEASGETPAPLEEVVARLGL